MITYMIYVTVEF